MKKLLCLALCLVLCLAMMPAALAAQEETAEPEGYAAAGAYAPDGVMSVALDGAASKVTLSDLTAYSHDASYAAYTLSKGIDVSSFQGDINWSRVKSDGVDFAVIRVGGRFSLTGGFYADVRLDQNFQGAIAQGIATGAYFFSQATTEQEAREEANEAIRLLGDWAKLLKLPIYIDMEYVNDAGRLYDADLTAAEHTKIALAFCKAIEQAGYKAGVYAGYCTFPIDAKAIADAGYEVWHAQWYNKTTVSPLYTMWQFASTGSVAGISGDVDLDFRYVKADTTMADTPVSFSDVPESAWYYDNVQYVVRKGLFLGMGDNQFSPKASMDREMFVIVLHRLAGEPAPEGESPFSDVTNRESWYYDAVVWGAENEIVTGVSADTFGVGQPLTRQEMVTLLCRYAAWAGLDTASEQSLEDFPDHANVKSWAEDAFRWAVENGVVSGVLDKTTGVSTLDPKETSTRAQVAAVIERFDKLLAAEKQADETEKA